MISILRTSFLSIIAVLTAMITLAQTSEHLTFKGVPIDGTLNEYVAKMKQGGFECSGTDGGIAVLKGDFAGYKNCYIKVSTLNQIDLVYKIRVTFPDQDTWSSLFANYSDLKQMLTEKYAKPTDVVELFDVSPFPQPLDDNDKMHEVKLDKCRYSSLWKTNNGEIHLFIDHFGLSSCFVRLIYLDKTNSDIIKEKAKEDL